MKEVEFKFELKKEQYEELVGMLDEALVEAKTYWNIYYDTPTFDVRESGCCLRITLHEDGTGGFCKPKACFKGRNDKDHRGLSSREEVEEELTEPITRESFFSKYSMIFSDDQLGLPYMKVKPYTHGHPHLWAIGGVKIHRRKYRYNGIMLEIDKVAFNKDTFDYELEVETDRPEAAYPLILSLLDRLEIAPIPSKRGKHGRFMKHRAKHGRETVLSW